MDIPIEMQRERITPDTARNWCGRVLSFLTKRDSDDFTRIQVRLGDASVIRYLAARYQDPMFVGAAESAAFRAFGEKVEAAYHEMVDALAAARNRAA